MLLQRLTVWIFPVCLVVLCAGVVSGQSYPNKPIRIVAAAPGGNADFSARQIAHGLSESLGQQVIVDNRGGSGIIAADVVAKSPPDGYTLLFYGRDIWVLPLLQNDVRYDPVKDFAPITLAVESPSILVVHPSLPVKNVKELIALAKANPGKLNYGSSGVGSSPYLAAELFKAMAGVDIVHVPYKGAARALPDLFAGQLQLMFNTVTLIGPNVKLGRLKALAVTSAHRTALVPGLPTMSESGLPGYDAVVIFSLFAPAGTPSPTINRINQETVRVLNSPEVKERFFRAGTEVVASSPQALAATVKSDMAKWSKVIKNAGIHG